MLYGHSFGSPASGQLLALQTAGFNNTCGNHGPTGQADRCAGLGSIRYQLHLVAHPDVAIVPPSETWLGPVYQDGKLHGDLLRLYITPGRHAAICPAGDSRAGAESKSDALERGSMVRHERRAEHASVQREPALDLGLRSVDPVLHAARPDGVSGDRPKTERCRSTYFVDPAAGRILARTDWSSNQTWFDYRASWESINHQDGDGGQFEFFRESESGLTKEMSNYDNNGVGLTTYYHNSLALKNWSASGTPNPELVRKPANGGRTAATGLLGMNVPATRQRQLPAMAPVMHLRQQQPDHRTCTTGQTSGLLPAGQPTFRRQRDRSSG